MDMLLALLLQSAIAPEAATPARGPQLSYASEATGPGAPRARINQGRSFPLAAMAESMDSEAQPEGQAPSARAARAAPGRSTTWNGAPVRMIDGRPHGLW